MRVLGIESSCDETAVAVYDDASRPAGARALQPGRSAPGLTAGWCRNWPRGTIVRRLLPLVREALARSPDAAGGASTASPTPQGPGLIGALLVGAAFAARLRLRLGQAGGRGASPRGAPAGAAAGTPAPPFPLPRPAGVRRPYPADRRRGIGDYRILGRDAGRCGRRGLRQDRQAARAALSRRARAGAAGRRRPARRLRVSAADARSAGLRVQFHWPQDRRDAGVAGPRARRAGARRCRAAVQEAIVDTLCARALQALEYTGHRRLVVAGGVGANRRTARAAGARSRCARARRSISRAPSSAPTMPP